MTRTHDGRTVLITGGASGIGLGIARRFLRDGARVAILDLQAPVEALEAGPDELLVLTGDAADEAVVDGAVEAVATRFGALDIMVNNAGVIGVGPVAAMDYAAWRHVMDVNVNSAFLGARAAARQLIRQGRGGSIINASSGAGRRGVPNLAAYCASKAAIIMLTQALAVELAPHRIRVNAYAPGHIETPFWGGIADGFARLTGQAPAAVVASFAATIPWGRFGTPEDVAATVSWLAGPEADFVSGQTIAMNGAEFPT